ncbi:MAG TPA: hypothetical protein VJI52_01690 [Candidatus Nanoarchaeia archaeon]|nr:hypothetical protein [Candidatus Nanoarchaeia archaeon]
MSSFNFSRLAQQLRKGEGVRVHTPEGDIGLIVTAIEAARTQFSVSGVPDKPEVWVNAEEKPFKLTEYVRLKVSKPVGESNPYVLVDYDSLSPDCCTSKINRR